MTAVLVAMLVSLVTVYGYHDSDRTHVETNQVLPDRDNWKFIGNAPGTDVTTLVFALKQQNTDILEDTLWRVSDPRSPQYGKHLTLDDLRKIVEPSPDTMKEVSQWLHAYRVRDCATVETRDFLRCRVSVKTAENLLETKFGYFQHTLQEHVIIRAMQSYSVPKRLSRHLDFIGGLHRLPNTEHKLKVKESLPLTPASLASFRYGVHPDTLRKRYNVTDHVGSNGNNSQAVAQFLKQYYSPADLKEFMGHFGKTFPHLKEVSKVVGPNSGKTGLEANLDVQYIMSLGANISTAFWSTGSLHEGQEPFLEWLLELSNTSVIPPVFSVSYGDHERSLSVEYMRRVNTEFQKVGVRGVSVLFASGDDGAGCHRFEDESYTFEPDFPSSSPYVTTVGGTMFTGIFTDTNEKANDISGGGFSNVFEMPKYQFETVAAYLNTTTNLPDSKYFNSSNRAYPDISALSDDFWIIINRLIMNVAGTSAATPTVAGMIALSNDARLNAGKPVLGFLNPFLYQNPDIFYDITLGEPSQACWLDDLTGYPVTEGWDPVTGLGTPNYPNLHKLTT